jgi:capsular polysaccharide transport system permease protein
LESTLAPVSDAPVTPSRLRRLLRRLDIVFVLTVLIPTLLASVYFGLVASDVYMSESRFVVRSPHRSAPTGLGALLQGTSLSRSQDDTYSVHDYIRSRDALRELDTTLGVRQGYGDRAIDLLSRFPGLRLDDSFEAFHEYYQEHVHIGYDTASAITVLQVRAYTAEQARAINDRLLEMGERLVNELNARSRQDLIEVAQREVREDKAKAAALALSTFRAKGAVFDPPGQSALQLQSVARLQEELIAVETQLAQLRQLAPNNSQVPVLAGRAQSLRRVIAQETGKVTGAKSSLNAQGPDYDRLTLEKGFAERQLGSALASLESARSEAQRKQIYLERLVQPNLPDMAIEPRRIRSVLTVLVLGLMAWGVVSLVLASVREHRD